MLEYIYNLIYKYNHNICLLIEPIDKSIETRLVHTSCCFQHRHPRFKSHSPNYQILYIKKKKKSYNDELSYTLNSLPTS